eukprot:CAMPEP_0202446080 /NCGR_PEP_ID=MMETSP1360-20130828/4714_1 /ASSEMBLY_ACC=CAM_ASM_000848 /TAXON_ID=515479 /ORGANISM="Licmophora paradoxa, Strain CCMP2313" /LENGTH=365 /DNA_ID=CAMNT_0049062505 /DNA_START=123 /DNA_END=1220 /DNA_ORIENTATION=-
MATNRTLIIRDTWISAYSPPGCLWETNQSSTNPIVSVDANTNTNRSSTARARATSGGNTTSMDYDDDDEEDDDNYSDYYTIPTDTSSWNCLYHPVSDTCETYESVQPDLNPMVHSGLASGLGVRHTRSSYFDDKFYGPQRVVELPQAGSTMSGFDTIDIIPHWERQMGRFWIRAQMAHYLWKPSNGLQNEIDKRLPTELFKSGEKYIAFHIRFTDNTQDLLRDFGRSAEKTRSLDRFIRIAERLRKNHPHMNLKNIYIASDSNDKVKEAKKFYKDWNIFLQSGNVRRSQNGTHEFMWFKKSRSASAGAVAADIEVLRRADFLVGSFQSNVYRLATELNLAYHSGTYSVRDMNRHFAVDIEWYEDP